MISTVETKLLVFGNGVTKNFEFTLPFIAPEDISCAVYTAEGRTDLVAGADFSVQNLESYAHGATIYLTIPPPAGSTLVIYRQTGAIQGLDLLDYGKFPAEELERALDRITMICQEFKEKFTQTLTLPDNSSYEPAELIDILLDSVKTVSGYATQAINAAERAENAQATCSGAAEACRELLTNARSAAAASEDYADDARSYANSAQNGASAAGLGALNAKSYAESAQNQAAQAEQFASNAASSAENAARSAENAASSAENAAGLALEAAKPEFMKELKQHIDNNIINGEW